MPIHVAEASDAGFASRFRQALSKTSASHIPRMNYVSDEMLFSLSDVDCPWPDPAQARFLVKAALRTACSYYYVVRKSLVFERLEMAFQGSGDDDRLGTSKLLALFALGEVFSTRTASSESSFPGLLYFVRSQSLVRIPPERPKIDHVEIMLLHVRYLQAHKNNLSY